MEEAKRGEEKMEETVFVESLWLFVTVRFGDGFDTLVVLIRFFP